MEDTQFIKTEFFFFGAGGFSREIASWYQDSDFSKKYIPMGYIDDNPNALNNIENKYKIVDTITDGVVWIGKSVVMGIASCEVKERLFVELQETKVSLLNFKHDTVLIGQDTYFGEGYVLCPNVIVSCNVKVGHLISVNSGSQIGHDVTIGNFTSIMANVDIGGGATIGNNVFIGSNAVILPGVKIPDNTRIGAGSVVIKSIKQAGTYFGVPAKKIF
ncbi:MAG: NeuD/PglB/VioB family sugar acetyltransferase [Flavobacterium sp.]